MERGRSVWDWAAPFRSCARVPRASPASRLDRAIPARRQNPPCLPQPGRTDPPLLALAAAPAPALLPPVPPSGPRDVARHADARHAVLLDEPPPVPLERPP